MKIESMRIKVNSGLVLGIITSILGLIIIVMIPGNIAVSKSVAGVSSRSFPQILAMIILVLSFIQALQSLFIAEKRKIVEIDLATQERAAMCMLLMLGTAIAARYAGVIISGIIAAWLMLVISRSQNWKNYLAIALIGVFLYFGMKYLMHLRLV